MINLWWDHVTEIPDVNKIIVFNNGTLKGSNTSIFFGGHIIPNSIVGFNLEWKNVQKKEMKKNTSEIIKSNIPIFNPFNTLDVCNPWKVPSRETSRHHWNIINSNVIVLNNNKL